jgi:hypothetical protein
MLRETAKYAMLHLLECSHLESRNARDDYKVSICKIQCIWISPTRRC